MSESVHLLCLLPVYVWDVLSRTTFTSSQIMIELLWSSTTLIM